MRRVLQARCPNAAFIGHVQRADMPAVLASADLFASPSETGSTNLALLEAQASGLPAVVMDHGSAHERTAQTGAVVCRADADFFVETAALIRNDARRRAMALAARQHALSQDWVTGLTSVYAEYRAAAQHSRVGRDLEPALIAQGRRF